MKLYRQTIADFGLYSGIELTGEEYRNLKVAAGQMSAKMRAVRIVAASGVSKKDLEIRLIQKGESTQDAKNAVAWMSELDLVDDKKTAEHIVSNCIQKGYGISRAKQALFEKKIPKEILTFIVIFIATASSLKELPSPFPDASEYASSINNTPP